MNREGLFVGIDIGGTNTRIGLFQTLKHSSYRLLARFPTFAQYTLQISELLKMLSGKMDDVIGIGLSIGARMEQDGRSVQVAPNLPDYVGKPFARDLEQHFGVPVCLAHDTVCGLLAEKKFGVLQDTPRCAYLTLSTGTGAAIHLEKAGTKLTVSIEIGHQLLDGNTLPCLCGQIGCLETCTGGKQLALRLATSLAQITERGFWETFCDKLALGLVNLVQLTRVETVAVGGAIALGNSFLLALLQQKVALRLRGTSLDLRLVALGEDAPLVGAVTMLEVPPETILH